MNNFEILKQEITECRIRANSDETIKVLNYLQHFTQNNLNNGWIDVDVELPNDETEVLGYRDSFKHGHLIYHCVFKDGKFLDRTTFHQAGKGKITHWQPLPQPPKILK